MVFNWIKCLVGILHLKPTAGCQISTLIFRFGGGGFINIPWTFVEGRQSSFPLKSKLLLGPLTDLSAWVWLCTSSPQQGVKYHLWYLELGRPYTYALKKCRRTESSFPLGVEIKSIARVFKWFMCLGGIMHLKPTVGCQISTLIFEFKGGDHIHIPWQFAEARKVLSHLGFRSKVLPGPLTDLSAWMGFCSSIPQ
jgi:hypothetical protein